MTLATAEFKNWEEEEKEEEVKIEKIEDQLALQISSELTKLGRMSKYILFRKDECKTQYQYWQATNKDGKKFIDFFNISSKNMIVFTANSLN